MPDFIYNDSLLLNLKNGVGHDVHLVYQVTSREVAVLYASIIYSRGSLNISSHSSGSFPFQLAFAEGQSEGPKAGPDSKELLYLVQITCQVQSLTAFVQQTTLEVIRRVSE